MKKENVVITCPPCGENVGLPTKRGFLNKGTFLTTPHRPGGALPPQVGKLTAHGFTLIELLVVVLIIGILAAVAVPQYQKAVEKARFASFIPLIKAVADAKSIYYLETGKWAETFAVLPIELPAEFQISDDNEYGQIAKNPSKKQYIYLEASSHRVMGQMYLSDGSCFLYYIPTSEFKSGITCAGTPNKRAEQFCKNLPGAFPAGTDDNYSWWTIP